MTARPAPIVISVFALSCVLTGCGGGSQAGTTPAVGDAFANRAAAVCAKALKSKQAWPPFPVSNFDPTRPAPSALGKVAPWLKQQVAPTFDSWLSGLRGLGQPKTGGQAWGDTISAV